MRAFFRALKTISVITLITLAFFSWTYLPLFQIAYAATKQENPIPNRISRQSAESSGKLEKLLEDLREKTGRAEEKAGKGRDTRSDSESIKSRKAEIDALDANLKKDFSATEKKLKDSNLPKEILNRHNAFVKNYENNLAELKANIDAIEKAKTPAALKAGIAKTRTHLEKVKPSRRHVSLDPNKLPNRMVKLKERIPRLNKEEFERDFPKQRKQKSLGTAFNNWLPEINTNDKININQRPILLAFNDSFTDMPFSVGVGQVAPVQHDNSPLLLLAQATPNLPSQDDLSETPEIQFTPEIKAKAQELGYKPVKIYEWVRNNIDYQPYYGSFKGAQQTLLEGTGNDVDQASLLIALLRVSQIEAKYAYGTIELPVEKVMNWVGGVTDPRMAGSILASKGIPARLVIEGGVVKYIQLEHVWVEAWIDYFPSRGAVHRTGHGNLWIPLDASYKQFTYKQGMDMFSLLSFNAEQFLQSYITDTRDITAYQDYSMRMFNYFSANNPIATTADIFGADEVKLTKTIVKQEFPFLLGTLPYKVVAKAPSFADLATAFTYSVTIQINGDSLTTTGGLSFTGSLNNLADKRITISYEPATASDEAVITRYDGNLLSVPPYLINVKPVLRVSGSIVATGDPFGLGKDQDIIITFAGPDGDTDRIQNIITAGAYSAIILQTQDTPADSASKNIATLIENGKRFDSPDISLDDLLGQLLYSIGVSYFHHLSFENAVFAKSLQLMNLHQPSEAMITHRMKVNDLFGVPLSVYEGGINVDVDRNVNSVYSPTQDKARENAFMFLSGLTSSIWENRVLETFFNAPAVSAVRLLKLAAEQGIPVYTITSANITEVLPVLQVSAEVKTDVQNAINAGKKVIISKSNLTYYEWTGVGYIVMDATTGAAGYMISGGLAGSDMAKILTNPPTFMKKDSYQYFVKKSLYNSLIVGNARSYLYTDYVLGGKDPATGFDCSGCGGEMSWGRDAKQIVYSCGTPFSEKDDSWLYIIDLVTKKSTKLVKGNSPDWH